MPKKTKQHVDEIVVLSVRVPKSLRKAVRQAAFDRDMKMEDLVAEYLRAGLRKRP